MVKKLPANAVDVRDSGSIPGTGNPLEEGIAIHPVFLSGEFPQTEEPLGLQSIGSQRVRLD